MKQIPFRSLRLWGMLVCLSCCLLSACSSLVYAPSLMMSASELKQSQTQATVGLSLLPETLSEDVHRSTHIGGIAALRYGFGQDWSMQIKRWDSFDGRGGLSGSMLRFNDSTQTQFIHAEFGMANNGISMDGWGLAMRYGRREQLSSVTELHAAIGPIFGWHLSQDAAKGEWGLGGIVNVGLLYNLNNMWSLGFDLAMNYQYDHANRASSFITSPCLTLGVRL